MSQEEKHSQAFEGNYNGLLSCKAKNNFIPWMTLSCYGVIEKSFSWWSFSRLLSWGAGLKHSTTKASSNHLTTKYFFYSHHKPLLIDTYSTLCPLIYKHLAENSALDTQIFAQDKDCDCWLWSLMWKRL